MTDAVEVIDPATGQRWTRYGINRHNVRQMVEAFASATAWRTPVRPHVGARRPRIRAGLPVMSCLSKSAVRSSRIFRLKVSSGFAGSRIPASLNAVLATAACRSPSAGCCVRLDSQNDTTSSRSSRALAKCPVSINASASVSSTPAIRPSRSILESVPGGRFPRSASEHHSPAWAQS